MSLYLAQQLSEAAARFSLAAAILFGVLNCAWSSYAQGGTEGTVPLSPAESLRALHTKPGLVVELAASEPLIEDPVAIDWGADGKLWVCEMNDYPSGMDGNWQPGGRIKCLEDIDGDGHYDRASVFLDGLPFPTGVTAWGRGIYVCAAPDILYAEDTNGDGKADKVEKVFTGFFTDNYQARVNSLSLGLDNWIYGANGLLGGNIRPGAGPLEEATDIRGHDFRFQPATRVFELVSGLTQQGRVRDDWGDWFGCNNSQSLFYFPIPERYSRRNPHVPTPPAAKYLPSYPDSGRVYPVSHLLERFNDPGAANHVTSGCGLGLYRDTLLGAEYYGNAFVCEPVHNLVHREIIDEAGFTSHRAPDEAHSEFLASSDNWFRPVQARTGPDGALYVVDMYRFLIEHPRWIPAARLAQIDARAGADKGRIYRVRSAAGPRAIRDLTKLSGPELAAALDSPNGTERDRVHIELLHRRDATGVPVLQRLGASAALPQVRIQALAVLEGLGHLTPEMVQSALADPDEHVRVRALCLAERFFSSPPAANAVLPAVIRIINDPSSAVRRQLAFTLGESRDPRAGKALAALARESLNDDRIREAILTSASFHGADLLDALMSVSGPSPTLKWLVPLAATAAGSGDERVLERAMDAVLPPDETAPSRANLTALGALLDGMEQNHLRAADYFSSAAGRTQKARFERTMTAGRRLASDSSASEADRVPAVRLLGRGAEPDELKLLCDLAATSASAPMRAAAVSSLKRQREPALADRLLSAWFRTPPAARPAILNLLMARDDWARSLLKAIQSGRVNPRELSLPERKRLTTHSNLEIRRLAAEVLPEQPATGRQAIVKRYAAALELSGNAANGKEIFEKNCASCHLLHGIGHAVGPDLAALSSKDPAYLVKNILDPNAAIEPRFINYQIELEDDRSLSGLITSESGASLTILSGNGVSETVLRSEVKEIRASALSLMPEGLEQSITPRDMADLLAFLKTP